MLIRHKLVVIVLSSVLIASIPAAIWVTSLTKQEIVDQAVSNLLVQIDSQETLVSERLLAAEKKLLKLSGLLQQRLQRPVSAEELAQFDWEMQLDADGVWRNKRSNFDGTREAGIYLPEIPGVTDHDKVLSLRIKDTLDIFGQASNRRQENVWYLSPKRAEVIFDATFPEFVYEQDADNDYTGLPWVTLTKPENNPEKQVRYTSALFDPVPESWMVSAVSPVYMHQQWIGAIGEDIHLRHLLNFSFERNHLYDNTQDFLIDSNGHPILVGKWQSQFEQSRQHTALEQLVEEPELVKLLTQSELTDSPRLLRHSLHVDGADYMLIGIRMALPNWRYYQLVPLDSILMPVNQLIINMTIAIVIGLLVVGVIITMTVKATVVSRITRFIDVIKAYSLEDGKRVVPQVGGNDELTETAVEFDNMAERLKQAEARSRNNDKRLKLALQGAGDGVWDWNLKTKEISISEQWLDSLGYPTEEFKPDTHFIKSLLQHHDLLRLKKSFANCKAHPDQSLDIEVRVKMREGEWKWILARGAFVDFDEAGIPIRMVGTLTDITRHKEMENALRQSSKQLREVLDTGPLAVRVVSVRSRKLVYTNRYYREKLRLMNANNLDSFSAWYLDRSQFDAVLSALASKTPLVEQLTPVMGRDNTKDWVIASYYPIRYNDEPCQLAWFYDVTDRMKAMEQLRLHASVFESASEGILISDRDNRIIAVNKAFVEITGYTESEVLGQNPSMLSSGRQGEEFYQRIWQAIDEKGHWRGEVWNRRKNGEFYAEILTISVVRNDEGEIINYIGLFADITEQKNTEKALATLAHYDALTGLANRTLMTERLQSSFISATKNQTMMAVCFLDLDGFKNINDRHGHDKGDKLLVAVAQRLEHILRSQDTVARFGGDEFVLLITELDEVTELDLILSRILEDISNSFVIDACSVSVTASIGVAVYPNDDSLPETLLRHADLAMYEAKQAGKNQYKIFDVALDQELHYNNMMLNRISAGLEADEFCIYVQPKMDVRSQAIVGVECLVRWQTSEDEILPPGEFLPFINNHDLIVTLGDKVLEQALLLMRQFRQQALDLKVCVNVASRQIQQEDFLAKLKAALAAFPDVDARNLQFEILETSALETAQTNQVVREVNELTGVQFALDDFGTGYSSLSYLRDLAVETLKIDRSFVAGMTTQDKDMTIIKGIIDLAEAFERNTVAEGVETEEQYQLLKALGCDKVQGYFISKPMTVTSFFTWLPDFNARRKASRSQE
jgi:diguanylate cyclase (GGDEF)-like protein/PAS domain S-box-containing protein